MKIVFLNLYQGKVNRGAETFVYELSGYLSKRHKVDVIAGHSQPKDRWPFFWRLYLDPPGLAVMVFTVKSLVKIWRERYDVVVPVNGGWQAGLVRLITWLYGGKMVIAGQSGIGWDDFNNLWGLPNVFVGLTEYQCKWAKRVNPFVRVSKIPNGVDFSKFKPKVRPVEVNLRPPIILSVGALEQGKRLDLLIKAVSKLDNVSLLLVGGGKEENNLHRLGEELLGQRFKIISTLPFDRMPHVYSSCNLFSYPTVPWESFGIVMLEAMACGLPVVAVDDPIRREIVGEGGMFVNPVDTEKYAMTLKKALDIRWGNKPRKQAERFGWKEIAQRYEEIFASLIK